MTTTSVKIVPGDILTLIRERQPLNPFNDLAVVNLRHMHHRAPALYHNDGWDKVWSSGPVYDSSRFKLALRQVGDIAFVAAVISIKRSLWASEPLRQERDDDTWCMLIGPNSVTAWYRMRLKLKE